VCVCIIYFLSIFSWFSLVVQLTACKDSCHKNDLLCVEWEIELTHSLTVFCCRLDATASMTTQAGKSSPGERRSSESSDESVTSEDEDVINPTSTSNLSSSDVTDLSGYSPNVDVEGDESPVMVAKRVRRGVTSKQATGGTACWHDSADKEDTQMVKHQHTETLIRRPIHGRGAARTKDTYIEYTTQCTVVSKRRIDGIRCNTHLIMALVLICAICIVSLAVSFFHPSGSKLYAVHSKSDITSEIFLQAFNSVRESFQLQTSGFWGVIRAAVKPIVFQENPDQPAVFVLVVPSDTVETSACFIRLFSTTLTSLFQTKSAVEFFTDVVSSLSPDRVKRLLDDQLRDGLASGSRIAIVHHLEKLHGESAMMLHAYCDNENAPFRRAIFILALFVGETSLEVAETEIFVEERLKVLWGDTLGTNKFYPLITRIAHSIAFVRPETKDALAQVKC